MNQNGLQDMLKNKVKLGADAAASAGPVGRNAQAGTDWKLNAEFLTYSRSKGLFAGLDLDGTVLSQNGDDTRAEYGADLPFETVLKGNQPVPGKSGRSSECQRIRPHRGPVLCRPARRNHQHRVPIFGADRAAGRAARKVDRSLPWRLLVFARNPAFAAGSVYTTGTKSSMTGASSHSSASPGAPVRLLS
jgi:hypothetical protein